MTGLVSIKPSFPRLITREKIQYPSGNQPPTSPFTLTEIKAWLGIDPADTSQDAYLTGLNNMLWVELLLYLGRNLAVNDYIDHIEHHDRTWQLDLGVWPVTAVNSILFDNEELSPDHYEVTFDVGQVHLDSPHVGKFIVDYRGGLSPLPGNVNFGFLECLRVAHLNRDTDLSLGPIRQERIDGSVTTSYGLPEGFNQDVAISPLLRPFKTTWDLYKSDRVVAQFGG